MTARALRTAFTTASVALFLVAPLVAQDHLPRAVPESVGMASDRLTAVSEMLEGYVARGEVAGAVALIARDGQVVHVSAAGVLDADSRRPMATDAIFRIASMTKPVTSVAIMMLVDDGQLALSDPVSKFIPAFADATVAVQDADAPGGWRSEPARTEMTIEHLLTHRSGLVYGFIDRGPVGQAYASAGVSDGIGAAAGTLADNVDLIAAQPLAAHPGTAWQYGVSTDVLGRVVEVVSGQTLEEFFQSRIFRPLGMRDTGFSVPAEKLPRLAAMHRAQGGNVTTIEDPTNAAGGMPSLFAGGAGLYSTADDYALFAQMLLDGGEVNGVRLLQPGTVELMTTSHTDDINAGPIVGAGRDFGLGFAIIRDPEASAFSGSVGSYDWYGIFGTNFWIDPQEKLFGIGMIQLQPNSAGSFREAIRATTYDAITTSYAVGEVVR